MGFLDDIFSTTKSVAATAGKKTDEAVKFSKLKLKIAQIKSEIKDKYTSLGELIYSMAKADEKNNAEFDTIMAEIDALYEKLRKAEAVLDELKQQVACPGCGGKTKKDFCYCPKCGTKLPEPVAPVEEAAEEEAPAAEEAPAEEAKAETVEAEVADIEKKEE